MYSSALAMLTMRSDSVSMQFDKPLSHNHSGYTADCVIIVHAAVRFNSDCVAALPRSIVINWRLDEVDIDVYWTFWRCPPGSMNSACMFVS